MAKGAEFEREFCRQLSEWWTDGAADDCFWRTSNSGGRATVRRRKGKKTGGHYGDVAATDDRGAPLLRRICFELKKGYDYASFFDLLDKSGKSAARTAWTAWLSQAHKARVAADSDHWMVVHRRDFRDAVAVFGAGLWNEVWKGLSDKGTYCAVTLGKSQLTAVPMSVWFECVSPDTFRS